MAEQISNNATTTLNGSITNSQTTLVVTSATGFPTTGEFRILVKAEGANTDEIMTVTAVSGTTFTIVRASEVFAGSQTASAHGSGAAVSHVLTAGGLSSLLSDVGASSYLLAGQILYAASLVDVALGKSGTLSSHNWSGSITVVTDGDDNSSIHTNGNPGGNEWVAIDLQSNYKIGQVRLVQSNGFWNSTSLQIAHSSDGSSWIQVDNTKTPVGGENIWTITATTDRYWRLYSYSNPDNWQVHSINLYTVITPIPLNIGKEGQILTVSNVNSVLLPRWLYPNLPAYAQAQTRIKQTYNAFAQAQASIV